MENNTSLISSNSTDVVVDKSEILFRGWTAVIISITCLSGLLGYTIYSYVIVKYKTSFKNPFYTLSLSMMVSDLINIVTAMIYPVPAIILGDDAVSDIYQGVVGFLSAGSWFWSTSHLVFMAFNRVFAVCFYYQYLEIFSSRNVSTLILLSVVYGFVMAGMMYCCTCRLLFKNYSWSYKCQTNSCAETALIINQIFSNGAVAVIVICMAVIFIAIRKVARKVKIDNKSLDKQQKREAQLVIQFVTIGVVLTLESIFFWTFPKLLNAKLISPYCLNLLTVLHLLTSCIHPYLYIFCGSEVKEKLCGNIGSLSIGLCKTQEQETVPNVVTV